MQRFHWLLLLSLSLAACSPAAPKNSVSPTPQSDAATAPVEGQAAASMAQKRGMDAMSPLANLLTVFASPQPAGWSAFDHVPGIHWRDATPEHNPDARSPNATMYRAGNLLLSGFGMVDVPDGKDGADAGSRQDNEGDVGVTLNGDSVSVHSIVLVKFYASDDIEAILRRQFSPGVTAERIAEDCKLDFGSTEQNTQKNAFFRIDLPGGAATFVESYVDEDGGRSGPGSTTFEFSRQLPAQRIAAMQCRQA